MTAVDVEKIDVFDLHLCPVCRAPFRSGPQLGGHVASVHPNANPRSGKWRRKNVFTTWFDDVPRSRQPRAGSLKRSTDTWPGKA
ncbi:MAG TPA: hypothetical protein VGH54_10330 [Mycobacterium sp.]|jgi:hypothetical protein|uniref:hypothetical protein n=1 Tax=Mycobacterium sp. TaxID=1785 RepID=UPI002F40B479